MQQRPSTSPAEFATMTTEQMRARLLAPGLFVDGAVQLVGTDEDRMVIGGVSPAGSRVPLPDPPEFATARFLDGRELAVVGVSGSCEVEVGGTTYPLERFDVLYVGRGAGDVAFSGDGRIYLVSALAHSAEPTVLVRRDDAARVDLGAAEESNVRTIRKYIHEDGATSAQLVVGITELAPGSVWNTMPAHVHERRTEIYLYTGMSSSDARIVHLAGRPDETRSIIVAPDEAVISPSWSIHTGAGTSSYAFVWAMAGANRDYGDVVVIPREDLR